MVVSTDRRSARPERSERLDSASTADCLVLATVDRRVAPTGGGATVVESAQRINWMAWHEVSA